MGKHDIKTEFRWEPMPDEFYKARIETLEREYKEKDREIEALEHDIEMLKGIIGELKTDMGDLILENQSLRDAVVRAALREVE
jgi:predicted RNase H-like nuclease (RuvC/YqgF family)